MPVEFCFPLLGRDHGQILRSSQDVKTNISNKNWLHNQICHILDQSRKHLQCYCNTWLTYRSSEPPQTLIKISFLSPQHHIQPQTMEIKYSQGDFAVAAARPSSCYFLSSEKYFA